MPEHQAPPSFRPNIRLSHMVYQGPEKRDYAEAADRMRQRVEHPTPPPVPDFDINTDIGPYYPWWVVVLACLLVAGPMVYLIWTCANGRCG